MLLLATAYAPREVGEVLIQSVHSAEEKVDVLRSMQMGMQGLMQASQDPAVLAQLMQDIQVRACVLA